MQYYPIPDFLTKYPLPIHFQMVTISHWIELGCSDGTQYLCLYKLFQNPTYFAQFCVTGDSFWLTSAILSNSRVSYQAPPTPPVSNSYHFSVVWARMLRLDSRSSSIEVFPESQLFCSIRCTGDSVWLTNANLSHSRIYYQTTPTPAFSICNHFSMDLVELGCWNWTHCVHLFRFFSIPDIFLNLV